MTPEKDAPQADAPLNPALKRRTETVYPTKERSAAPIETTSATADDGGGWPWIWLIVTAVGIALAVYFLI